jgi:acyl-coenzyme A synthetase/AMP-(fatty) acid ligase
VLLAHPDIVEAAVVSVPDAVYGEVVGVWIVPRERAGADAGTALTKEAVRALVVANMNPQVRRGSALQPRGLG